MFKIALKVSELLSPEISSEMFYLAFFHDNVKIIYYNPGVFKLVCTRENMGYNKCIELLLWDNQDQVNATHISHKSDI